MPSEQTPLIAQKHPHIYDIPADDVLEVAVNNAYTGFANDDAENSFYRTIVEGEHAHMHEHTSSQDGDEDEDEEDISDEELYWISQQRENNKSLPWIKRPSVWMVGLCLFFTALAISSAEPSRTAITFKLACNTLMKESSRGVCDSTATQILISNLTMLIQLFTGIVTMVASGKIGQLSDQYGRKLFISIIVAFFCLGRLLQFISLSHAEELPFYTILMSDVISSGAGGVVTLVAVTNSYISDVVESHERIYSLGLSVASLFIGLSIGPMVGNLILLIPKKFGSKPEDSDLKVNSNTFEAKALNAISSSEFIPLKFEIFLLSFVLIYCIFILPESRSEKARERSRSMSLANSNARYDILNNGVIDEESIESTSCKEALHTRFLHLFDFLKPLRLLTLPIESVPANRKHRVNIDRFTVLSLVAIDCISSSLGQTLGYISVLYGVFKFQWTSTDLGHFMAVACSSRATVLIILSPIISHTFFHKKMGFKIFKKQFDMVDYSMAELGLVAECVGYFLLYFAKSTNVFFVILVLQSLNCIAPPTLNSAIIKYFPELKIGEYFGATAVIKNFLTLGTPILFVSTYKYALTTWGKPELVFAILAVVTFKFCIALFIVKRIIHLKTDTEEDPLLLQESRRPSLVNSRRQSFASTDSMDVSSIESDARQFDYDSSSRSSPIPGSSRGVSFDRSNSFCRN